MVSRNVLSERDAARLDGLEKVVRGGLQSFAEVAAALMTIRDDGLFKQYASSFDAYVQIRFEISRSYAYRYIAAAETVKLLGSGDSPIGESVTEAVIRPITELPPQEQPAAWEEAKEAARAEGKKKPTARHTTAAVKARRAEKQAKESAPEPKGSTDNGGSGDEGLAPQSVDAAGVGDSDAAEPMADRTAPEGIAPSLNRQGGEPAVSSDVPELGTPAVRGEEPSVALSVLRHIAGFGPIRSLPSPTKADLLALEDADAEDILLLATWLRQIHTRRKNLLQEAAA